MLASGCQLANGTIVNLPPVRFIVFEYLANFHVQSECTATFSCSEPCWDEQSSSYRPCASATECAQAGALFGSSFSLLTL